MRGQFDRNGLSLSFLVFLRWHSNGDRYNGVDCFQTPWIHSRICGRELVIIRRKNSEIVTHRYRMKDIQPITKRELQTIQVISCQETKQDRWCQDYEDIPGDLWTNKPLVIIVQPSWGPHAALTQLNYGIMSFQHNPLGFRDRFWFFLERRWRGNRDGLSSLKNSRCLNGFRGLNDLCLGSLNGRRLERLYASRGVNWFQIIRVDRCI